MNKVKLNNLIQEGNIVIPLYLFKLYKKFNLTLEEFIFLMYLYNKDFQIFDPEKISDDLNIPLEEVLSNVSILTDKGILSLDVNKSNRGILEETVNLENFFQKISLSLIDELNEQDKIDDNIFMIIEREFNRKLTPMENEVIKEWQDNNYSDSLIKEAIKEASLNGVSNLRYIDKILFDWHKKGFKEPEDIKKVEEEVKDIPLYNYNWLDDDE